MFEHRCPAKVLRRKTKTDEVTCGLAFVAQHWTFLLCDDEEDDDGDDPYKSQEQTDSLSVSSLDCRFFPLPPMTLKDLDSLNELVSHLPHS